MAVKYARTIGGNWSTDATWSTSSGGGADTTKPVAGDTAYLDANSGSVTVDVASACAILDCSNYVGTLQLDAGITTTGNVTLVTGMTLTPGTATWTFSGGTFIPAGKTLYDVNINNATVTLSTSDLTVSHNLTMTGASAVLTGRTVTMTGGTWSSTPTDAAVVRSNLTFNGNVTVSGGVRYDTGTIYYQSGTITTTGSVLTVNGACTLNTNGMTWNQVNTGGGVTSFSITLTSNLTMSGMFALNTGGTVTLLTSDITCAGLYLLAGTVTGRTITMTGGTWSSTGSYVGAVKSNLVFAGNVTVSGTVYYGTGTLSYSSGTITTTGSTLTLTIAACTISTGSAVLWHIVDSLNYNVTLGADFYTDDASGGYLRIRDGSTWVCGTYNIYCGRDFIVVKASATDWKTGNNTVIFNGTSIISKPSYGGTLTFYNMTINAGKTLNITAGITVTTSATFTAEGTAVNNIIFKSLTASTAVAFNATTVGTVSYVVATDINSAGGSTVNDYEGTLLRTTNWKVNRTSTINSDAKIIPSDKTILSDAVMKRVVEEGIYSDATIKVFDVEQTINSDAKVLNYNTATITSDAEIKETPYIKSDAHIKVLDTEETISSDALIHIIGSEAITSDAVIKTINSKTINSDAEIHTLYSSLIYSDGHIKASISEDLLSDAHIKVTVIKTITSSARLNPYRIKDFYGNCVPQKDSTQDMYGRLSSVVQYTKVVPTGVAAIDMLKGDLIKVSWFSDSNYGYNVYRTNPGGRVKLNTYVITDTEYLVGSLTTDVSYTFVVVGVDGLGAESADSLAVSATPTWHDWSGSGSRYTTYTTTVNGRTDVILESVELGYGTSPSVASFKCISDDFNIDDSVAVVVNGRNIFNGIVKSTSSNVSDSGTMYSYIAYDTVAMSLMTRSSTSQEIASARHLYEVDITDQTPLQALETIWNKQGNYRIYQGTPYQLGTGYYNRSVAIGKNVISSSLSEDTASKIDSITVVGDVKKTTLTWRSFTPSKVSLGSYQVGGETQYKFYYEGTVAGWNIADIQIQAKQNNPPEIQYDPTVAIVPSDVTDTAMTEWEDLLQTQPKPSQSLS